MRPLIHIGYHKTGTTWLQRVLFQPENGYQQIIDHGEVFRLLIVPSNFRFDANITEEFIEKRINELEGPRIPVVSSELLSGNPFYGGRESDLYARRLREVAPEALILISIREQNSMMKSIYMQYLSRGGTMTPTQFFSEEQVIGYFFFSTNHLEFHHLLMLYHDLFGPDNVLVITQEQLATDSELVALTIAEFCGNSCRKFHNAASGRREAPSFPEYAYPLLRRLNHFRSGPINRRPVLDLGRPAQMAYNGIGRFAASRSMKLLFGSWHPIGDLVGARFAGRFQRSNDRLKQMLGPDFDFSGWPSATG